jgi:hypothetical protein
MLSNTLFQKLHYFIVFILFILFVFLPLKYIKYIAWIPFAVAFQWIVFDGCVLDNLHNKDRDGNCASCLKLFNTKLADYIIRKFFKNTNRGDNFGYLIFMTFSTIAIYRLIFNIDFIK